jgi:hypothetical protein
MKLFKPPKRLVELVHVLQYDTERQELGLNPILKPRQRILINQERAAIMNGYPDYLQHENLELIIQNILLDIQKEKWQPKEEMMYKEVTGLII